jgi:hypothetical protein
MEITNAEHFAPQSPLEIIDIDEDTASNHEQISPDIECNPPNEGPSDSDASGTLVPHDLDII